LAARVFELARELDVTSKAVLAKCRAEHLEIKNHMSSLSAGQEATIREWFSGGAGGTAVETAEQVDLQKARREAKKRRRKKLQAEQQVAAEVAEQAPAEVAEAAEAPTAAVAELPEVETPAAEQLADEAEKIAEAQPPAKQAKPPEAKKEVIKPAGPQVVPKPAELKGPRVVRVVKPDTVRPPRRRGALISEAVGPPTLGIPPKPGSRVGEEEKGFGRKRSKRRSPRRRPGRTADSGERLREWRDTDLAERSQRLAAAAGGGLRRRRASVSRKALVPGASVKAGPVALEEPITIKSLSAATGVKSARIIRKLMDMSVMATLNQVIDREQAEAVMAEYEIELEIRRASTPEEELLKKLSSRPKGETAPRAPVVTFLGHVDHGKTSLLDKIRQTSVVDGEAGGITQHIGAYRYDKGNTHVVFLDTPGHEAFTAMRARGANMTDVVVLVIAADDGVMPQTVEAISHAKAAGVPIVVALNKIDLPSADVQRAMRQLAEQDLQPREWGGQVEVVQTSATTGEGIETLVETLSLEAEMLELRGATDAAASGFVVEARMDPGLGVLATLLVLDGTLHAGDVLLAGRGYGRVRQMLDDRGRSVSAAGPATPVEVAGLDEVPQAGSRFYVVDSIDQAREVAEDSRRQARSASLTAAPQRTMEGLLSRIEAGEINELTLILKADVQGSIEALVAALDRLGTDEVRVNILHAAVGGISTGDVALAEASEAIIIGFNVVPDTAARQLAESEGVDIRLYHVIYEVMQDVRRALEQGLAPEVREETLGRANVRQIFRVSRVGTIAGCLVTDGVANRNAKVRIIRDNVIIEDNRNLDSLRRFKEDAREVRAGLECGIKIAGYDDIKEGDVLEFWRQIEVARTL